MVFNFSQNWAMPVEGDGLHYGAVAARPVKGKGRWFDSN